METFFSDPAALTLVLITFFAATVNGALGYGFSSLTVPVALLFYTNRVLNPALVLLEVIINSYVLMMNRRSVPQVWRRVLPMLAGLVPGVIIGSYALAAVHPGWIKFLTYAVILPFILIQAAGFRRYIKAERAVSVPFGAGVGILYSITTISGPPLALLFNNQGYVKEEFRAGLHRAGLLFLRPLLRDDSSTHADDRTERTARCSTGDSAPATDGRRNLPTPLHEFRRVGGWLWTVPYYS